MADELSAYELQRAENIRRNNAFLLSLGHKPDELLTTKPKKPKAPPKPKPEPSGPSRRSGRLSGEVPLEPDDSEEEPTERWEAPQKPDRHARGCWWEALLPSGQHPLRPKLTDLQLRVLITPLTEEQRKSLPHDGDAW